jgi:hypothetical protein
VADAITDWTWIYEHVGAKLAIAPESGASMPATVVCRWPTKALRASVNARSAGGMRRPPRTPSPVSAVFAAAAGFRAAIAAWRLLEEVTMKTASMPTPSARPDRLRAPWAYPERPPEHDAWSEVDAFDDDCVTPAKPTPVPAELRGERFRGER